MATRKKGGLPASRKKAKFKKIAKKKAPKKPAKKKLKYTTSKLPTHTVSYFAFEEFINAEYGLEDGDYSFTADSEIGNDSSAVATISGRKILGDYEQRILDAFRDKGEYSCDVYKILLQDLVNQTKLPAGTWIIDVCW